MTIKNQKIDEFLESVASASPTPGGGATAALVGALAAALVEMVCNLTIGRKNYIDVEKRMILLSAKMKELRHELMDLADADSDAFSKVMEAYKSKDKSKIEAALFWATEVPKKVVELADEVRGLAVEVAKTGNKNAYSDAASAEYLANAAIESAQENIEINIKTLASLKSG
jgi:formiminotetrahydrofolate cyclodeaminase